MYAVHPSMPVLSAAALRRLELFYFAVSAVLAGVAGGLSGPAPGPFPALAFAGGVLAAQFAAEAAVRLWARRRALPFVPRRDWRRAWREASGGAPAASGLVPAMLLGLALVQFTQGRPVWAFGLPHWAGVAACAVVLFLVKLCTRRLPSAEA